MSTPSRRPAQTPGCGLLLLILPLEHRVGVWDDHDLGRNDAGKDYPHRTAAQGLFLDFLNVSQTDQRRRQAGVYWARRAYRGRLQVIALDTRSHRESYYLPSVGGVGWLPFAGLIAALGRCVTAVIGLGQGYTGDVLGETQWGWLERTLTEHEGLDGHQRPELTVVISSVQVTTTNPVFESWGHFPAARRRLLALLQAHRPTGLLLISGDAHIGEIAASAAGTRGTLEVTSSGLTHSCVSGPGGSSCEPMLQLFAAHRQQNGGATDYFTGGNFGGIEIEWPARRFTVSVFDLEGTTVLSATRSFDDPTTVADAGLPSIFDHRGLRGVIIAALVALACLGRLIPCRRRPGRMNAPPKRE